MDEIFPYMDSVLHLGYSVIIFAVVSVIAIITLYYIMPRTKSLSVEGVSDMFRDTDRGKLRKYNIVEVKDTDGNLSVGKK